MPEIAGSMHLTSYDVVPYVSASFPQTHPDRLATIARVFGLRPPDIRACRVLELGCAMGTNLLPMAWHLPGSEFVGVDASATQVAAARQAQARLGLGNVMIEHASILDINEDWGVFDYVICHGVYSWVDDEVRQKILSVAARNLAPDGVAYVSYNTYPGWHMREAVRHMMKYHASHFDDVADRLGQARAFVDFVAGAVDESSYYGALLREEVELVRSVRDSYLFHEHLEDVNSPEYFHQFVSAAAHHGLRYLGEAEFSTMVTARFGTAIAATLDRISPDIVRAEQYMDFLRNRFFRQTLLCHAALRPDREVTPDGIQYLLVASPARPVPGGSGESAYETPGGRRLTTAFPATRAVLDALAEAWPGAVDQATLYRLARERLSASDEEMADAWPTVQQDILHCYSADVVELRTWQAECAAVPGERPRMSGLARRLAELGPLVTNQRHEPVSLSPSERSLARLLDGSHDRQQLLTALTAMGSATDQAVDAATLEKLLTSLAQRALLEG